MVPVVNLCSLTFIGYGWYQLILRYFNINSCPNSPAWTDVYLTSLRFVHSGKMPRQNPRHSDVFLTRMHSSRMLTARSLTVSCSICRGGGACMPHTPPVTHIPLPCMPLCHAAPCHIPPAMHAPCHAHPPPCTPPAMHASLPHMPPAMHTPCHAHPPAMHTPLPCAAPPLWTDRHL